MTDLTGLLDDVEKCLERAIVEYGLQAVCIADRSDRTAAGYDLSREDAEQALSKIKALREVSQREISDPIEKIVAKALPQAQTHNDANLDFYLPEEDIYIEVKQMHSPRIAQQMARADNVIAIQGKKAAEWFANQITQAVNNGDY